MSVKFRKNGIIAKTVLSLDTVGVSSSTLLVPTNFNQYLRDFYESSVFYLTVKCGIKKTILADFSCLYLAGSNAEQLARYTDDNL